MDQLRKHISLKHKLWQHRRDVGVPGCKRFEHVDKFGQGRFRTKIAILLFSSTILTLGAAFRAGIGYVPRPRANPAWYHSKACFYIFNFMIEIIVVYLYAFMRVDKRFHIPNGVHGPGSYSSGQQELQRKPSILERVVSEEEAYGPTEEEREAEEKDLEAGQAHVPETALVTDAAPTEPNPVTTA